MAIDFTRADSDKIVCTTVPIGGRPFVLECWFKVDSWAGVGITYGALMGIYATSHNFKVMLRIERNAEAIPTTYLLQFVVKNADGTFVAESPTDVADGNWHHALGFWRIGSPYTGAVILDGSLGTGFATSGLILGLNEYTFGYDPCAGGDAFNGQMCEWATWYSDVSTGSGTKWALTACKGWNPIDRAPFFFPSGGIIRLPSWVQGHKLGVFDIMRPTAVYTETGVSKGDSHAPVFEAPHCEPYPRPPLVVATRRVTVGGYCSTDTRKLLAG